ncbi:MAG: hypothetical protein AB4352_01995 [Hormoscilla sp.]
MSQNNSRRHRVSGLQAIGDTTMHPVVTGVGADVLASRALSAIRNFPVIFPKVIWKSTETGIIYLTPGIAPNYPESVFDGVGKMYLSQEDLFNQRLRHLVKEAQSHKPMTKRRQLALERLIREVQKSPQFYRPPSRGLSPAAAREIYQEASQELWFQICRGIDNYQSQKGEVIAWINEHFRWRFKDAVTAWKKKKYVDLDPETVMQTTETPSLMDRLRDLIAEDPDGIFRQTHITDHPEANFQALALRWLEGQSWEQMTAELGIKSVTLRQFYRRQLKKLVQKLREDLQA